jgi:hypothetical protein
MNEEKRRMNEAFKVLRRQGLVARQDYKCCMSCALSALETDMETPRNKKKRGFVYYHRQDKDSYENGYPLHLRYGAREEDDKEKSLAVGVAVCIAFARQGFEVEWDGNVDLTIQVRDASVEEAAA